MLGFQRECSALLELVHIRLPRLARYLKVKSLTAPCTQGYKIKLISSSTVRSSSCQDAQLETMLHIFSGILLGPSFSLSYLSML